MVLFLTEGFFQLFELVLVVHCIKFNTVNLHALAINGVQLLVGLEPNVFTKILIQQTQDHLAMHL